MTDGTDGPAAEADGTGETDSIPVPSDPSVPSWFRETLLNLSLKLKPSLIYSLRPNISLKPKLI